MMVETRQAPVVTMEASDSQRDMTTERQREIKKYDCRRCRPALGRAEWLARSCKSPENRCRLCLDGKMKRRVY